MSTPMPPHHAGDDPAEHVSGAIARWLRTQPVLAALLVIELPVVGGFVVDLLNGKGLAPAGVVLAIATPLVPIVLAGVRQAVTPTAKPQLVAGDDVIPLVPAGDLEESDPDLEVAELERGLPPAGPSDSIGRLRRD